MRTPRETTQGPWERVVVTKDAAKWAHWINRPCAACGHAFGDHENAILPAPPTEPCEFCDCKQFEEPSA